MLPSTRIARDLLLTVLGLAAGACDAAAFERLGHVFASVVTGNLVLLGVSAVRPDASDALYAGVGILGYGVGVLVTAPRSTNEEGPSPIPWPPVVNRILLLDLVLLICFGVGWELMGTHPSELARALVELPVAAAMGAQSSAVRRMGPWSTTYLTSTLTGVLESLRERRLSEATGRGLGIIVMAVAGAAASIALLRFAQRWVPLLPLVTLAVVIVVARRRFGPYGDRP